MSEQIIYDCYAYRQSNDPDASWILSFVAKSEDILKWAGIPRRSEERQIGFQRTSTDKRVAKAKEFFMMSGNNQSPTALVLGIHPIASGAPRYIKLDFLDEETDKLIRKAQLTVDTSFLDETIDSTIDRLKKQIEMRLPSVAEEDSEENDEDFDDTPESDDGDSVVENGEGQEESEIEIGRSILGKFLNLLDDAEWVKDNEEAVREIALPATIIDGQHRVLGAAACEKGIPFTICALYDCQWPEQIYQFTVVNYTSVGIPDQFITANAALSLTKSELDNLEDRLVQAGVKVVEYELMRVVHFDSNSPFYNLVNLTDKRQEDKIGYKTMVRVAKRWYNAQSYAIKEIVRNLYPDIVGQGSYSRKLERWKDGDWGEMFLAFWTAVRDRYAGERDQEGRPLWQPGEGTNLMTAIVLYELQEAYLTNLNAQDESLFVPSETGNPMTELSAFVKKRAEKVLEYFPAKFFAIEWKTRSLNTSAGRKVLISAFEKMIRTKGRHAFSSDPLVTGQFD